MSTNRFFCPECSSEGIQSGMIFLDDCPECGAYENWAKNAVALNDIDSTYITPISLTKKDGYIWGEYSEKSYFFVRLRKNCLPVPTFVYDLERNIIYDPITLEILINYYE